MRKGLNNFRGHNSKSSRNVGFLTLYPPDQSPPLAVTFSKGTRRSDLEDDYSDFSQVERTDLDESFQDRVGMLGDEDLEMGAIEDNEFTVRKRSLPLRTKTRSKSENISTILEDWNESEITKSFEGLSFLEKNTLIASWKGEMNKLSEAIMNQSTDVIETNKLVNTKDNKGRTCLHFAAAFDHSQIVQFLIHKGANVNVWDKYNAATPLICAAAGGSKQVIDILISHGADVNAGLNSTLTPLHWAIQTNSEECVKKLLDSGATLNSFRIDIGTPLHHAASLGNSNIIEILIQKGADVSLCKGKELWTPLHVAVNEGCSESCIETLLKAGAQIEARDSKGQTALHIAASNLDYELLELLLSYKADPNARDLDGRTPVHKSISKDTRAIDCILSLIEASADLNIQDKYFYSPLHLAAIQDSPHCAAFLLQHGADVTLRTKTGQSCLSFLVKKMPHVIRYIRETLDNAVSISMNNVDDPELELRLDFRAMVANPTNANTKPSREREQNSKAGSTRSYTCEDIQRETEFLTCLISTGHKSYLSHPLIEAFYCP